MAFMAHIWKRPLTHSEEASRSFAPAMPLDQAPCGCPLRLLGSHHGHKLALRLAEMGLLPGTEFIIIQKSGGPILISVRGARIAIGKGVAAQCLVEPVAGRPANRA